MHAQQLPKAFQKVLIGQVLMTSLDDPPPLLEESGLYDRNKRPIAQIHMSTGLLIRLCFSLNERRL
jgi:hypothetical protein